MKLILILILILCLKLTFIIYSFSIIKKKKKLLSPGEEPKKRGRPFKVDKDKAKVPTPPPSPPRPATPEEPTQKLKRSEVKKIIIPKKKTLLKRAMIEAKRKAKELKAGGKVEEEEEALPEKEPDTKFPKKDGDNSQIDESNVLSGSRTRHAKPVSKILIF